MLLTTEKLVRDFFYEIKFNQQDSAEKSEIDFNLISRFLDNDLSKNDIIRVEQFKKKNPELTELFQPIKDPAEKQHLVIPTKTGKIFRIADLLKVAACLVLIISAACFVAKFNKKETVEKKQTYIYRGIHQPEKKVVTNVVNHTLDRNKK